MDGKRDKQNKVLEALKDRLLSDPRIRLDYRLYPRLIDRLDQRLYYRIDFRLDEQLEDRLDFRLYYRLKKARQDKT